MGSYEYTVHPAMLATLITSKLPVQFEMLFVIYKTLYAMGCGYLKNSFSPNNPAHPDKIWEHWRAHIPSLLQCHLMRPSPACFL